MKKIHFFNLNEDMNDINKIKKSLEILAALIDGVTETVKHEIKKQERRFLGAILAQLAASLVQSVISSLVKCISGRGVKGTGKGYMDKKFLFPSRSLSNIEITKYFNYKPSIMFKIFLYFLTDEQIFLSPKVKRSINFSNKLVYTSCLISCRVI